MLPFFFTSAALLFRGFSASVACAVCKGQEPLGTHLDVALGTVVAAAESKNQTGDCLLVTSDQ